MKLFLSFVVSAWLGLCGLSNTLLAQDPGKTFRYHSLSASLRAGYFYGDLSSGPLNIRPGLGLGYQYRWKPRITFVTELGWMQLQGDDFRNSSPENPQTTEAYIRNLHFRNNLWEGALGLKFDLTPHLDPYRKRPGVNVYVSGGFGLFWHNPKARDEDGKWTSLSPLKTEAQAQAYSNWAVAFPVALGFRYRLGANWDIEPELSFRFTTTDYLDDVSGNYADPADLESQEALYFANRSASATDAYTGKDRDLAYIRDVLGRTQIDGPGYSYIEGHGPGEPRGFRAGPDTYLMFSIRLIYIIPNDKVSCPKYRPEGR